MQLSDARALVRTTIDHDPRLCDIVDMLQVQQDPSKNVIQVDGITCVWVPIGSTEFITAFVKAKTSAMVDDMRKLRVLSDPLTHTRLVAGEDDGLGFPPYVSALNRDLNRVPVGESLEKRERRDLSIFNIVK
jgi:hypothetical protein